ncbi:protection of telomeres protein 1a-like isoform X2 [Momordica charantia]|uniref:Protection of telomeres protein 1a-like isoform X2 n=1 Tax=Momordica charantia TaxID=3673 RepID=A0A6J1C739_MOMCH|nr:protection of telomeres protein 1a-like isoform X2 [Momordica charantia]
MESRDDYKFMEIRDAIASINQKVNLIAVIIEFGFPRRTKGTDYFCAVKIVDQSQPKPGITANIFAESLEKLPHVASAGDIIQLSRVVMKTHQGEIYVVFNKKFSSFALYEGQYGTSFQPYDVSPKFQPRDLDKKFILSLRDWLVGFELDEGSTNFSFVRDIKESKHVNLICKDAQDGALAFVWDGTDAQPISIDTKLANEIDNAHQLGPMLPRDKLCTLPSVGSILRLIFDKGTEKQSLCVLESGKWVKFINVLCEMQVGFFQIVVTAFSKLRYMPEEDHAIQARQRSYEERLASKLGRISFWSFPWPSPITEVDYNDEPFVTLMDVLTYPKVTAKFKCVVRVVAVYPLQAKDFCSPEGTYRVRLSLEDSTARIHALLYAEDGCKFFDGHPSVDALTRKRNKLLGVSASGENEASIRNPPWVQCCLKSYYLNKQDLWGSRRYRLFGTRLVVVD